MRFTAHMPDPNNGEGASSFQVTETEADDGQVREVAPALTPDHRPLRKQMLPPHSPRLTAFSEGRKVAWTGSVLNLLNTIMGSGLLSLPYILRNTGIAVFISLMVIMGFLVCYSLLLLVQAALITNSTSYAELGYKAFGAAGKRLVCIFQLGQAFGSMCTYMVVVRELGPDLMRRLFGITSGLWANKEFLCALQIACISLPLAHLKSMSLLAMSSSVSIMILYSFGIMVVAYKFYLTDACIPDMEKGITCQPRLVNLDLQTFLAVPTITFSFLCHAAALPVFAELQRADVRGRTYRGPARMFSVVKTAIFLASLVYFCVSIFGYLTFYDTTRNDILQSYTDNTAKDDWVIVFMSMALMISFDLSVPSIHFPFRKVLNEVLNLKQEVSLGMHMFLTCSVIGIALVLALAVPFITTVMSVFGATTSVSLVFLLPTSIYVKLERGPWLSMQKFPAVCMFLLGVFIGILSLGGIIYGWCVRGFGK